MFRFSLITLLVGLMASLCVDAFSHKPAIFVALTRIKNMNKQLSNRLIKDSEKFGRCEITCLELPCIECVTEEAVADSLRSSVRDQDAVLLTSPKVGIFHVGFYAPYVYIAQNIADCVCSFTIIILSLIGLLFYIRMSVWFVNVYVLLSRRLSC